ncbi:hypothetical protein CEUSTIGMA_g777.t1 [Chlamydomonas eustigma]|uniref:Uncharacterized protein n=1 Tax=Chlamydomonas eustigma TaxID=1157962 RepID=A0A250WR79_9CHLO|nr:hypothetical protein CEUSTIGMA_g777.t1 [Chlamydomonas eustigma]|eukprot:GAX73323.1 hypothetical protein CEUSTIGMA_g777.t1 [Chlamydomonas eustigma]
MPRLPLSCLVEHEHTVITRLLISTHACQRTIMWLGPFLCLLAVHAIIPARVLASGDSRASTTVTKDTTDTVKPDFLDPFQPLHSSGSLKTTHSCGREDAGIMYSEQGNSLLKLRALLSYDNALSGGDKGSGAAISGGFISSTDNSAVVTASNGPGSGGLQNAVTGLLTGGLNGQGGMGSTLGSVGSGSILTGIKSIAGLGGPQPPPPIASLGDLSPALLQPGGGFVDVSQLGGPQIGISSALFKALQGNVQAFFSGLGPEAKVPLDLMTKTLSTE